MSNDVSHARVGRELRANYLFLRVRREVVIAMCPATRRCVRLTHRRQLAACYIAGASRRSGGPPRRSVGIEVRARNRSRQNGVVACAHVHACSNRARTHGRVGRSRPDDHPHRGQILRPRHRGRGHYTTAKVMRRPATRSLKLRNGILHLPNAATVLQLNAAKLLQPRSRA